MYKKKGSKYYEQQKELDEITHYGEDQLKKLKALFNNNPQSSKMIGNYEKVPHYNKPF